MENEATEHSHDHGVGTSVSSKPTWTDLHAEAMKAEHLQTTVTNLRIKLREYDRTHINKSNITVSPTEDSENYFGAEALTFFLNDQCNLTRYLLGCKYDLHKCIKKMNKTLKFYLDYPSWVYDMIPIIVKATNADTTATATATAREQGSNEEDQAHPYKALLQKCDLYTKLQDGNTLKEFIFQLKEVDAEKHTIFIIKIKRYLDFMDTLPSDQANACYQEQFLLRLNLWFFHQISFDPFIQLHGITLVGSFADLTMWDSTMKLPNIAPLQERKSMFLFLQNCIPLRVGGFWIFEEPFYVRWLFSIISLVMKEKFRERFHICGSDYSAFCQYLGSSHAEALTRERLPLCLGGTDSESTVDILEHFCRQFAQLHSL